MVGGGGREVTLYVALWLACVRVRARATLEWDQTRERGPYWAFARECTLARGPRCELRADQCAPGANSPTLTTQSHPILANRRAPSGRRASSSRQSAPWQPRARRAAYTTHPHPHHGVLFRHATAYPLPNTVRTHPFIVHPAALAAPLQRNESESQPADRVIKSAAELDWRKKKSQVRFY